MSPRQQSVYFIFKRKAKQKAEAIQLEKVRTSSSVAITVGSMTYVQVGKGELFLSSSNHVAAFLHGVKRWEEEHPELHVSSRQLVTDGNFIRFMLLTHESRINLLERSEK